MLKEIFVIENGVLLFHYSSDPKIVNSDESILSSGLLTAIQDFSEGARSDALDSFTMENEFFLFKKFPNSHKTLVGVYEKHTPQSLSRKSLIKIFTRINDANLPDEKGFVELDTPEKRELKNQILELSIQLFGTEEDVAYVTELLERRTDIPLAILLDATEKKVITKFARPKPLFKQQQVTDFFLLNSTLGKMISRLGLKGECDYFCINTDEYVVATVYCGKKISITTGSMNSLEEDVLSAALQMCYFSSLNDLTGSQGEESEFNSSIFQQDGTIEHVKGTKLPSTASVFILTLINNLNSFSKLLTRRRFVEFQLTTSGESSHKLILQRKGASEDFFLRILRYS
ncbi:MAG: hypothetical protein ACW97Z_05700 [Candidatus Hodarchaeales archaeon]|jgi:hypothetical protein